MPEIDDVEQDKIEREYQRQERMRKIAARNAALGMLRKGFSPTRRAIEAASKKGIQSIDKKGLVRATKGGEPSQQPGGAGIMIALLIAVAKDLLDVVSLESLSGVDWIVDIIIGVAFFGLIGGFRRKQMMMTRKVITTLGSMIVEAIPGLGFLPIWTLSVLYLYFKASQGEES